MSNFIYNPNEYTERNFNPIPEGNHRVRVTDVTYKHFSNGKSGFEVKFDVNAYNSKLWYYITIDPQDTKRTNQKLGSFFNSFAITNYDLDDYGTWVGCEGAVRVKHNEFDGRIIAQVAFCLNRNQQSQLSGWMDKPTKSNVNIEENISMVKNQAFTPRPFGGVSF